MYWVRARGCNAQQGTFSRLHLHTREAQNRSSSAWKALEAANSVNRQTRKDICERERVNSPSPPLSFPLLLKESNLCPTPPKA